MTDFATMYLQDTAAAMAKYPKVRVTNPPQMEGRNVATCAGCRFCRPELAPLPAAEAAAIRERVDTYMERERVAARRRLLEQRIASWIKPVIFG